MAIKHKSCIKYYEYAMSGAVTLASHVLPYSTEVPITAKNNRESWKRRLEELLQADRTALCREQRDWVMANQAQHRNAAKKPFPGGGFRCSEVRRIQDHSPHPMSSLIPNMRWNANGRSEGPRVEYLELELGAWLRHPVELAFDFFMVNPEDVG